MRHPQRPLKVLCSRNLCNIVYTPPTQHKNAAMDRSHRRLRATAGLNPKGKRDPMRKKGWYPRSHRDGFSVEVVTVGSHT